MNTTTHPDLHNWQNTMVLTVVQACIGLISEPMKSIWIEFEGGHDISIHIAVREVTDELVEDAKDICGEALAYLGANYAKKIDFVMETMGAGPAGNQTMYRRVYLAKF